MSIPEQTRRESHDETNRTVVTVSKRVYGSILNYGPGGAWEIARRMGRPVYTIRPRITELFKQGKIKDIGTRWCEATQRNETVWDVVDHQLNLLSH